MTNKITEKQTEKIEERIKKEWKNLIKNKECFTGVIDVYADAEKAVWASSNSYTKCIYHDVGGCKKCTVIYTLPATKFAETPRGWSETNPENKTKKWHLWNDEQENWELENDVIDYYIEHEYDDNVRDEINQKIEEYNKADG